LDTTCALYRRWLLHNNAGKTSAMIFGKGSHSRPPALTRNETITHKTSSLTYLGLRLDSRLSFAGHIRDTAHKAQKARGALLPLIRCRSSLSPELKLRIYNTCLRPVITYGVPVWLPYISTSSWAPLQRFQNVCVKHLVGRTRFSSTTPAHELSGQPPPRALLQRTVPAPPPKSPAEPNRRHPSLQQGHCTTASRPTSSSGSPGCKGLNGPISILCFSLLILCLVCTIVVQYYKFSVFLQLPVHFCFNYYCYVNFALEMDVSICR